MTTTEYRDNLIKQYEELLVNVQRMQGAIAACNDLIEKEDDELTTEIEADESDA